MPQFVLRELQRVADATDPRRRARGKRGFEVVQRLLRLPGPLVEVDDTDVPEVTDVDEKLLELAKARGAKVITTDYNLNKRAELSGVTVLNVNDLSNALKPAAVAGETMRVHVLREGKEPGQGVAYLDDGTMVVVDRGKPLDRPERRRRGDERAADLGRAHHLHAAARRGGGACVTWPS